MRKDMFNRKDIRFFLIPFLVIVILFAVLTFITANNRIKEIYEIVEGFSLNIADCYSKTVIHSQEASNIISELLDEKLLVASQAVLLAENNEDNKTLTNLAEKFQIDEIYLYNDKGVILYSNVSKYIGWKAYEGHPVYDFMKSNQETFVEDIRQDTESGIYYKYAYVKGKNNTFVQIGVLADNIHKLYEKFEMQHLIDDIVNLDNIQQAFFTDKDFKIIASSIPEYKGMIIQDESIREHVSLSKAKATRSTVDGNVLLHVCAPVYYNSEKIGTLSIVWPSNMIDTEIKNIISNRIILLIIVIITIGSIIYYAYRKNNSNIQIAYYDKLTGLPNSDYLAEYLEQEIRSLEKNKKAILLLNCTNFKVLNMTYGFLYGNQILQQITDRIKALLDPEDMLFRFNADRFVLVLDNYENQQELENLAQKIIDIFKNPFPGQTEHNYINAEISIFEIQDDNLTVDKVLQDVSLALTSLEHGSNKHIVFYNKEMEIAVQREDKIEKALRAAIQGEAADSFYLEFQPKKDLKTKIIGFEALARLSIPGLGKISPIEFIALAEKRMLIYDLGNLILLKACEFLGKLKQSGYDNISVAVNISGIQLLRDEFMDAVKRIVNSTEIDIKLLEFEITESVLIENFDLINKKLVEIKNLGITVSLDDFGTGFSSFARLSDLNIDTIKIDRFFISRIAEDNEEDLITADIISMAHKIGLTVVAEGVEEEIQKDYLEKHDCDIIQGYYLSKPLAESDAIGFLK